MLAKAYLVTYNVVQCLGWAYMLYLASPHLSNALLVSYNSSNLYHAVATALLVFQTAAILEVVHAATGLVKSNPVLTAFQVASRLMVTWMCLYLFREAQASLGLALLLLAWDITEIIRYAYYAINLLDLNLSILTWMRYAFYTSVLLYAFYIILYVFSLQIHIFHCFVSHRCDRRAALSLCYPA